MENYKKLIRPLLLILLLVMAIIVGKNVFFPSTSANNQILTTTINPPAKKAEINKSFTFPLLDKDGKKAGEFNYTITSAELRDEIIVKGARATAVKGRDFLIVNLKLVNSIEQNIQVNTRDYIRLIVNKNEKELLGADLHNDPVEVQGLSTKYTRVGFGINDTDRDHLLIVGEINGDKERIPLTFK